MKTWRNPVNSGYKSRAAPGMRNRAPYPDQKIDMPGRPSGDKRHRCRSPGDQLKRPCPRSQRCDEITEETALIAIQKNCRALFEQQSHRAPELISGLGQTYLKVDISTSVETVSRDRHHNLVCSRRANSETVVMLVLSAVLEIHLLWHMRCAGFSCNSKRAMNPLPRASATLSRRS